MNSEPTKPSGGPKLVRIRDDGDVDIRRSKTYVYAYLLRTSSTLNRPRNRKGRAEIGWKLYR